MRRGRLLVVVAVELAAVFFLSRLGSGFEWSWGAPPEQAIGALVTAAAVAVGYWLALSAIAYTVAAGLRRQTWIEAVGLITAAPVQRLVGRALALSMMVSSVAAPAAAGAAEDEVSLPPALAHLQQADAGASHIVQPGDNLWDIARARVTARVADPSDVEVAGYWLEVIAANQTNLLSRDPDLIYPGETIVLPEW